MIGFYRTTWIARAAALSAVGLLFGIALGCARCGHSQPVRLERSRGSGARAAAPGPAATKIVAGAREEVARGVRYDASYRRLRYPGGDVPPDRGACTDVVIRALRRAGCDLQKLIHQDMRRHFRLYPRNYGLSRPDRNIDHRRTPNQVTYLRRHGLELPRGTTGRDAATWLPGDLVYWELPSGQGHCGVLSDRLNGRGLPLVIHNLGGAREEDCLTAWKITGHFRFPR